MTQTPQLGDAAQIVSTSGTAAAAAVTATTSAATAAVAVPIIGAGVAAAILTLNWIKARGARKKAATEIVNELEPVLRQNLAGFQAGPQTAAAQAAALAVFDDAWQWLTSRAACGNPDLKGAGQACIQDRAAGGAWDWFRLYRDPIAAAPIQPTAPAALDGRLLITAAAAMIAAYFILEALL